MFTPDQRDRVRAHLLEKALEDRRISCAAITGSTSHGAEDRWSDIDLFFGVADGVACEAVIRDWSDFMYSELGALHHFDVRSEPALYRVFLLPCCLEVDLAFTPASDFGQSFNVKTGLFIDIVTDDGIAEAKLPVTYPFEADYAQCRSIGTSAYDDGAPGIACRSHAECTAASFVGEELAVFDRYEPPLAGKRLSFERWYPDMIP